MIGLLLIFAVFSIVGSVIFYFGTVNVLSLSLGAMVGLLFCFWLWRLERSRDYSLERSLRLSELSDGSPASHAQLAQGGNPPIAQAKRSIILLLISIIANAVWWNTILGHPITDAVRSPWLVVNPVAIIAPAIALVASFVLLHRGNKTAGSIALFVTLFSLFASASVLFPLGYGFDPFLHRSTISYIAEHGTITPKPLYYIGEYSLELFGNLLGGIPVAFLDAVLIPLIAALTLTVVARKFPIGITILFLGLGAFTTSTPQSLAYCFLLMTIVTIPKTLDRFRDIAPPLLFALAAMVTHPIAGVPALLFVAFSSIRFIAERFHMLARLILFLASALALPAMFALQAEVSHADISLTWEKLWRLDLLPLTGFLSSHGNVWLDGMYLVLGNLAVIIFIFALAGAIARWRKSHNQRPDPFQNPCASDAGVMSVSLLMGFVIVSLGIDFQYLIEYERQDFALRLLTIATIFALPLADEAIAILVHRFRGETFAIRCAGVAALFLIASSAVYGLYPRHDGYVRSAAFNVSQADFDTVYAINHRETEDADYIVLSNQATAAAALQEFGFRKYYHGDIFYYPIPTGGALYQDFLSMVDVAPTRETIVHAMNLAGVHKAYFVVSDYWWKSDAIIENAKLQTDEWFAVDGGKATVFIFDDETVTQ